MPSNAESAFGDEEFVAGLGELIALAESRGYGMVKVPLQCLKLALETGEEVAFFAHTLHFARVRAEAAIAWESTNPH